MSYSQKMKKTGHLYNLDDKLEAEFAMEENSLESSQPTTNDDLIETLSEEDGADEYASEYEVEEYVVVDTDTIGCTQSEPVPPPKKIRFDDKATLNAFLAGTEELEEQVQLTEDSDATSKNSREQDARQAALNAIGSRNLQVKLISADKIRLVTPNDLLASSPGTSSPVLTKNNPQVVLRSAHPNATLPKRFQLGNIVIEQKNSPLEENDTSVQCDPLATSTQTRPERTSSDWRPVVRTKKIPTKPLPNEKQQRHDSGSSVTQIVSMPTSAARRPQSQIAYKNSQSVSIVENSHCNCAEEIRKRMQLLDERTRKMESRMDELIQLVKPQVKSFKQAIMDFTLIDSKDQLEWLNMELGMKPKYSDKLRNWLDYTVGQGDSQTRMSSTVDLIFDKTFFEQCAWKQPDKLSISKYFNMIGLFKFMGKTTDQCVAEFFIERLETAETSQ